MIHGHAGSGGGNDNSGGVKSTYATICSTHATFETHISHENPLLHLALYEWNDAETFQSRSLVHSGGAPRSSEVNYRVTHGQGRNPFGSALQRFYVWVGFFGFIKKKYPTMDRHHPSTNGRIYI